ncbi:MAG: HAD family phosphatase [Deltaproteobacteria bacterium]|nr:HAD family phosphatase [Deltaproteobacteria bacterium]
MQRRFNDFDAVYRQYRPCYDNGRWSGREYWLHIFRHYNLEPNDRDIARLIRDDVASWMHINKPVIRFVQDCKRKAITLAIISNMPRDLLVHIEAHAQWLNLFDASVFSCNVGINKPAGDIYALCLDRLGLSPDECLFVDDSHENVRGARAAGMASIQFTTLADLLPQLAGYGLIE